MIRLTPEELCVRLALAGGPCDLHTHTVYCDGKSTVAEMAAAAHALGFGCFGFSGHAHTPFDDSWCMSREDTARYRAEVAAAQVQYCGRMDILLGLEQDLYSDALPPDTDYDYFIGSVHYLQAPDGSFVPVDESADCLAAACRTYYGGDYLSLAEHYYATVAHLAELAPRPTIIGHFDLIKKFNRGGVLFDETAPRYLAAARAAIDALLPTGALFECNLGAMTRGWREEPYPSATLADDIRARGGRLITTGDTHAATLLRVDCGQLS